MVQNPPLRLGVKVAAVRGGRRQGLLFGCDAPSCPDKTRGELQH